MRWEDGLDIKQRVIVNITVKPHYSFLTENIPCRPNLHTVKVHNICIPPWLSMLPPSIANEFSCALMSFRCL